MVSVRVTLAVAVAVERKVEVAVTVTVVDEASCLSMALWRAGGEEKRL